MPVCEKCALTFPVNRAVQGIRLTRICEECIVSDQVVNKTSAIAIGARPQVLDTLGHKRQTNPRCGVPTYLFLRQEVEHVASIADADRREKEDKRRKKIEAQAATKKARQEDREKSLQKRTQVFLAQMKNHAFPTAGLVSGDFCTSSVKTPRMSVGGLCKRVILWRTLNTDDLPCRVNLFSFACERKLHLRQLSAIESSLSEYRRLLDTVVLSEGNRILQFLSPMERLHTVKAVPGTEQELYGLPVADMSDDMYALCRYAKKKLDKMQADDPVLRKLIIGKTTDASWNKVLAMLISRSGHVIPRRIGYYGVSRVFEMICSESPRWKRKGNVTDCVSRMDPCAPSYRLMEVLQTEYVESERLTDFQSIEHIVRIFKGRRTVTTGLLDKFRLLRARVGILVYEGGKTWEEATQEAYHTLFFECDCGNAAAKLCVLRKCKVCCHREMYGVCLRHGKGLGRS